MCTAAGSQFCQLTSQVITAGLDTLEEEVSEGPGLDWAPEPQPDEQAASDRGKETEEEVDSGC